MATFGSAQISVPLLKCSLWIPSSRIKFSTSYFNRCFPSASGYFYFNNIYRWMLLLQPVLSRYTYFRHFSGCWGKKKKSIERKSKHIILPHWGISHRSVSVVWIVRAGENPDLFLVWWNLVCLYHFHDVLVTLPAALNNGYVSDSFSRRSFYSIDNFAFLEIVSDWKHLFIDVDINPNFTDTSFLSFFEAPHIIIKTSIKNKMPNCILISRI